MPRTVAVSLAASLLMAGCAADSPFVQSTLVLGSGYDALTCPEVVARYNAADRRTKELAGLMEKSGSPIANALAYDTEYAAARANKRYAEEAAARKGCELASRPVALEPPPPVAAPAGAKK
jgi:hypothetical protein